MNKILTFLIPFFFTFSCHTSKLPVKNEKKDCLSMAIDSFAKVDCDKGLNIKEYTFQGKQVYVFDQSSCGNDMTSEVFDNECKSLGFLGGFIGNVTINGEDFSNAVFVKTIWEKP